MWPKNTIKGTESSHTALIFPPKTIQNVIFGFLHHLDVGWLVGWWLVAGSNIPCLFLDFVLNCCVFFYIKGRLSFDDHTDGWPVGWWLSCMAARHLCPLATGSRGSNQQEIGWKTLKYDWGRIQFWNGKGIKILGLPGWKGTTKVWLING